MHSSGRGVVQVPFRRRYKVLHLEESRIRGCKIKMLMELKTKQIVYCKILNNYIALAMELVAEECAALL